MEAAALVAEPNDERLSGSGPDPTQRYSRDAVPSSSGPARWEVMWP